MIIYRNLTGLLLLLITSSAVLAMDQAQVTVGSATFRVEVAQTPHERAQGLMFRRELPPDQGMLFIQSPSRAVFWMKNTYIPLDLLYFDADGRLAQIVAEVPPCTVPDCPSYSSHTTTIRYVLELNAGAAAQHHIEIGDRLRLEP